MLQAWSDALRPHFMPMPPHCLDLVGSHVLTATWALMVAFRWWTKETPAPAMDFPMFFSSFLLDL